MFVAIGSRTKLQQQKSRREKRMRKKHIFMAADRMFAKYWKIRNSNYLIVADFFLFVVRISFDIKTYSFVHFIFFFHLKFFFSFFSHTMEVFFVSLDCRINTNNRSLSRSIEKYTYAITKKNYAPNFANI